MKRKAFETFHDHEREETTAGEPPRLDDSFLAAEILPRLPAHVANAFSAANAFFRSVLTDPDFWLAAPRRAPPPHAACLVVRAAAAGAGLLHEFHYADAGFTADPAASRAAGVGSPAAYRLSGTCNGVVLLAAPWSDRTRARGVLFNPASGEDATVAADMPGGGVFHRFCGLGYSRSSKSYKALLCVQDLERNCNNVESVELMVVDLGGAAAEVGDASRRREETTPRSVAATHCANPDPSSLSLDGKVYVLPDIWAPELLAFDADDETVKLIGMPSEGRPASKLMEVWGRPCVATVGIEGGYTMLWTLTPEHRWELQCWFGDAPDDRPSKRGGMGTPWISGYGGGGIVRGAWDCGDGFLFVMFRHGRGYIYSLREGSMMARVDDGDGDGDGAAHDNCLLAAELRNATFCWGYQPTLIPPVTVLGGAACPDDDERGGFGHFCCGHIIGPGESSAAVVRPDRRCLEPLMEMMRKRPQR